MDYGFALPNNIHSIFKFIPDDIYTFLKPKNSISRRKLDIILKSKLENDLSCSQEGGLSWSLLSMLRLLALDEEALPSWERVLTGCPVSAANERQVELWAVHLIQHTLEHCCSQNSDMVDSSPEGLTPNMLLALQLRNEEVSILQETLKQFHCKSGEPILDLPT